MRTHNAGVVSLNPGGVTIKSTIGEEGNGKLPHKSTSLENTQRFISAFC